MVVRVNGSTGIITVSGTSGAPSLRGPDGNSGISFDGDQVIISSSGLVAATFSDSAATINNLSVDTTTLEFSPGSSGTPTVAPSGDLNTGIYFPAADTIGFAEGGNEAARIDSSGRLLVGTSTARTNFYNGSFAPKTQIAGLGAADSSISLTCDKNNTEAPSLILGKTRSTSTGGNTLVSINDGLGTISFQGSDGTELVDGARIACVVDGTPGADDMPGRLVFSTTADGSSTPVERMRLNNIGALKVRASGVAAVTNNDTASHEFTTTRDGFECLYVTNRASTSPFGLQIFHPTDVNNTTAQFLQCYGSSTLRAGFRTNGGLANFQANNVNLSDINTKKDISVASGTWNCIKEWEIVNYRYRDQPDDADLNLGVIAQQVAESCPEVITVFSKATEAKAAVLDDDGNEVEPAQEAQPEKLGVKEQQMYWMAIKALQEAQTRIETLETANASQAATIAALDARLASLESA